MPSCYNYPKYEVASFSFFPYYPSLGEMKSKCVWVSYFNYILFLNTPIISSQETGIFLILTCWLEMTFALLVSVIIPLPATYPNLKVKVIWLYYADLFSLRFQYQVSISGFSPQRKLNMLTMYELCSFNS